MKVKHLTFIIAIFLLFSCKKDEDTLTISTNNSNNNSNKNIKGVGSVTTKSITVAEFDEIISTSSIDVKIEKGTEGTVSVTAQDNIHTAIDIKTESNKLYLGLKDGYTIETNAAITATVPYNDISKIEVQGSGKFESKGNEPVTGNSLTITLSGSGDVNVSSTTATVTYNISGSSTVTGSVEATTVSVTNSASSSITLTGSTTNLELTIQGSGDFKGFGLTSTNTTVNISASGNAEVVANTTLNATTTASGSVTYKGSPTNPEINTSGSGTITKSTE